MPIPNSESPQVLEQVPELGLEPWSELAFVDSLRRSLPGPPPGELWIGDDAAVVRSPREAEFLVMAVDMVVEGVHADLCFEGLDDLGWKAVARTVSDIAAMGADPGHALVAIAVAPRASNAKLQLLYEGIAAAATSFKCPIVGGDLSSMPSTARFRDEPCHTAGSKRAPWVISVTVTGSIAGGPPPVRRSGARPGDLLALSGPLGAASAGLRALRSGNRSGENTEALLEAHRRPKALVAHGRAARLGGATAMIDVSDGLGVDLGRLADESGVGFVLDYAPVAPGATLEDAIGGGEDYQLIMAVPDQSALEASFAALGLEPPLFIGRCLSDPKKRLLGDQVLPRAGWVHGQE